MPTRKSIDELLVAADALFQTNANGQITATALRTYLEDFVETMKPAYAAMTIGTTPLAQALTTIYAPMVFTDISDANSPEYAAYPATGQIVRDLESLNRLTFNVDLYVGTNRQVDFALFRDGVITPWAFSLQGNGNANPQSGGFTGITYTSTPGAVFELRVKADADVSVSFANTVMIMENIPVRHWF